MGPIETYLNQTLSAALKPTHFELNNESHSHGRGAETHFRVVAVSERFLDLSRVERHRVIHELAKDALIGGGVHALSVQAFTPSEWAARARPAFNSPTCAGRNKS